MAILTSGNGDLEKKLLVTLNVSKASNDLAMDSRRFGRPEGSFSYRSHVVDTEPDEKGTEAEKKTTCEELTLVQYSIQVVLN